jgi:tetratricopeptide (TPR) repeat protein
MNRYWGSVAVMAAIALSGGSALAKDAAEPASVWTGCGENVVSGTAKFMVGPTAARALTPKTVPAVGIERCTTALKALDAQAGWERRAALLRSRAKFYVAARQHREALADLDAIAAIERPDMAYTRSFGVSLHMLRAIAYLEAGRRDDAADEAFRAMQARPWNLRIAEFAFSLSRLRTTVPPQEKARWDNLVRLNTDFIEKRATSLARAGDWAEALADWQNATPAPGGIGQSYISLPNVRVMGMPGIPVTGVSAERTAQAAITAGVAGRPDLAGQWLAQARTNIAAPHEPSQMERNLKINADPAGQRAALEKWSGLIEVAALLGKGDAEGAAKQLEGLQEMPESQITLALIRTVIGKLPAGTHPRLRLVFARIEEQYGLDGNERFVAGFDPAPMIDGIPDHEDVMLANPYRSAVKFLRANGFSVKMAKDGKSATVTFFGNKSHPLAIGEMALLRAAELTLAQGKPAFRVTNNDEYVQTTTMTMHGTPVGPTTVSGHSVTLTVEFVDAATADRPESIIQAAEVQAALAPIYVKAEGQ